MFIPHTEVQNDKHVTKQLQRKQIRYKENVEMQLKQSAVKTVIGTRMSKWQFQQVRKLLRRQDWVMSNTDSKKSHHSNHNNVELLCTVKAWVHLNRSDSHIWGHRSYMERAMNFTLGTYILDILKNLIKTDHAHFLNSLKIVQSSLRWHI